MNWLQNRMADRSRVIVLTLYLSQHFIDWTTQLDLKLYSRAVRPKPSPQWPAPSRCQKEWPLWFPGDGKLHLTSVCGAQSWPLTPPTPAQKQNVCNLNISQKGTKAWRGTSLHKQAPCREEWYFQALDMKTTQLNQKQISVLALHLIFHHFSPFNCCLSVVL